MIMLRPPLAILLMRGIMKVDEFKEEKKNNSNKQPTGSVEGAGLLNERSLDL